jgi:hypothetical protein
MLEAKGVRFASGATGLDGLDIDPRDTFGALFHVELRQAAGATARPVGAGAAANPLT